MKHCLYANIFSRDIWKSNQKVKVCFFNTHATIRPKQSKSTPGIYIPLKLKPCSSYRIEVYGYTYDEHSKPFVWIYDRHDKERLISNYSFLPYFSNQSPSCDPSKLNVKVPFKTTDSCLYYIGVLFTSPCVTDECILHKICVFPNEEPCPSILPNPCHSHHESHHHDHSHHPHCNNQTDSSSCSSDSEDDEEEKYCPSEQDFENHMESLMHKFENQNLDICKKC